MTALPAVAAVWTDQKSITTQKLVEMPNRALAQGEARFRLQRFAITANNVTYAATGFDIGYWKFFPTGTDGQGLVPVWGMAEVSESNTDVMAVGDRVYGFFPMAEELFMEPSPRGKGTIMDMAAHRADLPAVYNIYTRAGAADPAQEHYRCLLQPLIATSYLLYDWLMDSDWFGAEQIIIGSASSKTGLGLTACLAAHENRPYEVVGLTGAGNQEFVERLGYCDQVLSYDSVEDLAQIPSVYVDMAGHAGVKKRLHARLADHLRHSSAVGISHWDQFAPPKDLAGPKPQFFFAPAQIAKRREDWGPGVIEERIGAALARVAKDAAGWMEVRVHKGLTASLAPFLELAQGKADPTVGHVVELT